MQDVTIIGENAFYDWDILLNAKAGTYGAQWAAEHRQKLHIIGENGLAEKLARAGYTVEEIGR